MHLFCDAVHLHTIYFFCTFGALGVLDAKVSGACAPKGTAGAKINVKKKVSVAKRRNGVESISPFHSSKN